MNDSFWIISTSALIALLTPAVFVSIRESVKLQRQEVVRDLEAVFQIPGTNQSDDVIPAFEFVKYKYFFSRQLGSDIRSPRDYKIHQWIVSSIPLILTSFAINILTLAIIEHAGFGLDGLFGIAWLADDKQVPLFGWVVMAAYIGASLYMVREFFRAVNNFDLSPMSLLGAWVNLLLGVAVSLFLVFGFMRIAGRVMTNFTDQTWDPTPSPYVFSSILLVAFTAGYLPDLATRTILRASQLRGYKPEDQTIYKSLKSTPVEIIDGIDIYIRSRLSDYHITSVQNLAAANPLMLFVETPYGVFQIMDWVAQAQLCCSVGPLKLIQLWKSGIRTIFDLEKACLENESNEEIIRRVGQILLGTKGDGQSEAFSREAVVSNVRMRLRCSHTVRLKQLFDTIEARLRPQHH